MIPLPDDWNWIVDMATAVALGMAIYHCAIWATKRVVKPVLEHIWGAVKRLFSFTFRIKS